MGDEAREDLELFRSDRAAWEGLGDRQREEMLAMSLEKTREAFEAGKSPTDRRLLAGPWIHGAVQAALEPGNDGWLGDGIAGYLPWASISVSEPRKKFAFAITELPTPSSWRTTSRMRA
jgi:hypothetical protein